MAINVGMCTKPMWWAYGTPAGLCGKPAFGEQEPGQERSGEWVRGRFVPSYVPRLACYHHGGPLHPDNVRVYRDGASHDRV